MGIINNIQEDNILNNTVQPDTDIARYRPMPQNINPVQNPIQTELQAPGVISNDISNSALNPRSTLNPDTAVLGNFSLLNSIGAPDTTSPLIQPQIPQSPVNDLIGFGNVTQPQMGGVPDIIRPELAEQPEGSALDIPTFIPPAFDYNSLQPRAGMLYGGHTRQELNRAMQFVLPDIEPANVIQQRFIPNSTRGQTPRQTRVSQSQSWLGRVLSGVRGNNLTDRLINTLLWRINPFLGAQFGTPRSEFARTGGLGFTRADGTQWRPDNDTTQLETFGEYGSGALGLLFYGLDFIPNMARAAILDIGANTRALGNTLSQRGGASIWRDEWREDFGENRRLYDAVPDGHEYESYVTRALFGDDFSFINFQESRDGTFNPMGVLGESADDFYREQDQYQNFIDNPLFRSQTNWFQRFMMSPSARLAPRALAGFGLEVYTDPQGGALFEGLNNVWRRMTRRSVQAVPPLQRLLPAADIGSPRPLLPGGAPSPRSPIMTSRGSVLLPDNFVSPSAQPRVAMPDVDVSLGRELRERIRQGMNMQDAINDVARMSANPDQFRNIRTPQWSAPRNIIIDEVIAPQWGDVARTPRMAPNTFPVRRSPIERTTLINSIANILPPGLTNRQIDRVVDALPTRLSDEIALAARNFGSPVPQLPAARTPNLPSFVPNVGNVIQPIDNITLARTARNTVLISLSPVDNAVVNFDEFDPLVRSLREDFPFRLEMLLPGRKAIRDQVANLMERYGFTRRGNRMISIPVAEYENLADIRRAAFADESDFIVRRAEQLRQQSPRTRDTLAEVTDLPNARAVLQGWRDDLLRSPEPTSLDAARELRESDEAFADLFQRADDLWDNPIYDDVRDVPRRREPTNVVEMVARNTGRPRGQYTDNVVSMFNRGELALPPAPPRYVPTQDELIEAARQGDQQLQEILQRASQPTDVPRYDSVEQMAVDQLVNPDIVNTPEAYAEVRGTLPDSLAPYSPSIAEREIVQEYVQRRTTLEGLMSEHSDLMYQLDQSRTVDVEAFYDELIMAADDLEAFEEPLQFLREDPMYEVLTELYNDMIDERSARNVQRYLSQLEHTIAQQVDDLTTEIVQAMDNLFTQEDVLRQATNTSNRRYIDDVLSEADVNRQLLDEQLGQSSRGNCI